MWGVGGDALPLEAGEVMTLTIGDDYYWAGYSYVDWPLSPDTPIYAQVDSANADTAYGAILEIDEIQGLPNNNILGPVYPVPGRGLMPGGLPSGRAKSEGLSRLPPRR